MSYTVYPVIDKEPRSSDYRVLINGKETKANTAWVSAVPFNRRWPGHQREKDQAEAIQFLSLSTDEPLSFEIIPTLPFEEIRIRPQSLGILPTVENGTIRFTLDRPAYFTVEAYGRNRALHIFADPMPNYRLEKTDANLLYFGAGEHDIGVLELKSNQTLFIDEGAVVYGCIHAIDAQNIKILGRGILDNSKNKEQILFETNLENNTEAVSNAKRRHTVELEYCTDIEIEGITLRDSLVYNIRPIGCENLTIQNVKIIGCWRYNSDGIDMHNCVNVHISNCFIRTFDDSICVKGFDCYYEGDVAAAVRAAMYRNGKAYDVFKHVLIEKCVIWNDWGRSLEIGAETKAEEITDITFRDCDLIHLTGSALDCMNVDYADVHHVTFRDIRIECDDVIPAPLIQKKDGEVYENPNLDYMPPTLALSVVYHHEYSKGSEARRGRNRDFLFENIHVFGKKSPKVKCVGFDEEHKTENVLIRNLFLNGTPIRELSGDAWLMGDFTDRITLEYDPYSQMAKNTVDSKEQLKESDLVKFHLSEQNGTKILFVGNSITLHGIRPEIGWHRCYGMAASSEENDYVHRLEKAVLEKDPNAAFSICQVANWERQYKEGRETLSLYESARDFGANMILIRLIENCPKKDFDEAVFKKELDALVQYLDKDQKAKLIVTTGFWRHPGDEALRSYAKEKNAPCVELGDLGEDDAMKAIGLFEHKGVANHPGDLGMKHIAERIAEQLLPLIQS
ncbi:MAG: right-handed parallel beta-helix repeat-containing protein [Clostridia bacterium]|nr:right-handed parallel beta-helix repeat-containing protein [Clostridia bacterium]